MIETPHITELEAAPMAVIPLRIPREQMPHVFGAAVAEIMSTLGAQRISPTGPVFAHHFRMEPGIFDFEIGVPVSAPIAAAGRVQSKLRPAIRVVRTVYHGPYEGLPTAWGEFHAWVKSNGHAYAPDIWECYVEGPHSTSDPSEYRTELNRPLADSEATVVDGGRP